MNWEANLAAVIKHTDANLKQQFRQFNDLSSELGTFTSPNFSTPGGRQPPPGPAPANVSGNSFASAFLRDTMATMRGDNAAPPPTSFAQHLRERQDRKRNEQPFSNNRTVHDECASECDDMGEDQHHAAQPQYTRSSRCARSSSNHAGLGFQMYTSPTYDMAQMMEQVRLSLKLEVDARAAVAERQLSALLQLCKTSSEELDRLRIEVCAADRQLHTLDQVQSKMRQELTTQKDIGFHLQSMCGKDESWRMQAENQLLEMRQMVAAIREQGNAVQMQVQDKLSRQELLVQFNAAIEPIKAQFQATLQHQSTQLAEVTRGASSSSLLLDALTQKVNRVQSDEIVALRNEVQALKIHVSRMGALDGRGMNDLDDDEDDEGEQQRKPTRRTTKRMREREVQQERDQHDAEREREQKRKIYEDTLKKEVLDVLIPQAVLPMVKNQIDKATSRSTAELADRMMRELSPVKQDLQSLDRLVQENWSACQRNVGTAATACENLIKQSEHHLRAEWTTQLRDVRDKHDQQAVQLSVQLTALLEARVAAVQGSHKDVVKLVECEQKDRKGTTEHLQEELRKSRHALEEQLHVLSCDQRTKLTALGDEVAQKLRDNERKWSEMVETASKQSAQHAETVCTAARIDTISRLERLEVSCKGIADLVTKLECSVVSLQEVAATAAVKIKSIETSVEEDETKPTRRASMTVAPLGGDLAHSQLASIDSLLQKMMLQMQLQLQHQQQQMVLAQNSAIGDPTYSQGFWPAPGALSGLTPRGVTTSVAIPADLGPSVNDSVADKVPAIRAGARSTTVSPLATAPVDVSAPPAPSVVMGACKPAKAVEMKPDQQIDDIISRVVAEELAVPPSKPTWPPPSLLATPKPTTQLEDPRARETHPSPPSLSLENPANVDSVPFEAGEASGKVQQTLASTAKGATTEAELAKQRIEARRKQDQEMRQQNAQSGSPLAPLPPPRARASSTSSLLPAAQTEAATSTEVKSLVTLARSNSLTAALAPTQTSSVPPAWPPVVQTPSTPSKPPPPPPTGSAASMNTSLARAVSSTPTTIPCPAVVGEDTKVPPSPLECPPPAAKPSAPLAPSPLAQPPAPPQITHILCDQCRLPVRSDLLLEHMQRQCIKRTVSCAKCQVKFPWHEVDNHERGCAGTAPRSTPIPAVTTTPAAAGSSTPTSPSTSSAQQQPSPSDTSSEPAPAQLKKCRHCSVDVLSTELFDHELKCDQVLKQCPHCLRRQKVVELQDHIDNCDCRLVSCPNECGGKFLQRGIDKHLTTRCPKRSTTTPILSSSSSSPPKMLGSSISSGPANAHPAPPPPTSQTPASAAMSSVRTAAPTPPITSSAVQDHAAKAECKFCDEEFSAQEIEAHENRCDWKPKRCQHCNMVIISRDLLRHESSCKTTTKSCPHCNDTMTQSAVLAHSSRCSKRPIKCIRCCQLFPADSIVSHSSSCKFIPSSSPSVAAAMPTGAPVVKIPPPPPYPPTATAAPTATSSHATSTSATPAQAQASGALKSVTTGENVADRLARRSVALSQLTNQPVASSPASMTSSSAVSASRTPAAVSISRPEVDEEDHEIDDDEEDEDEEEDEEDDEQLTLAQVVAEWSVENVCLWLHEDVGVPEVVPRFQQRRCNGEILLQLTESDLINDYGIKNRVHRERILSAIDATKTSDDFSDDDEEGEDEEQELEDDDDDDEDDEVENGLSLMAQAPQPRASMSRLTLSDTSAPRDLMRRNSLPLPQQTPTRVVGATPSNLSALPSSSAMLRRINSALNVEFPSASRK